MRAGSTTAFIGLAACMGLVVFVSAQRAAEVVQKPPAPAPALVAHARPPLVAMTSARTPAREPPADLAKGSAPSPEAFFKKLEWLQATDKASALSFARQGEGWYESTGELAEARKAMIVTLLVDTGDMAEARRLARRFIEAFPASEYRPMVQGVTGIHPRPSGPH